MEFDDTYDCIVRKVVTHFVGDSGTTSALVNNSFTDYLGRDLLLEVKIFP